MVKLREQSKKHGFLTNMYAKVRKIADPCLVADAGNSYTTDSTEMTETEHRLRDLCQEKDGCWCRSRTGLGCHAEDDGCI
jgi:hypothetical protein